ncbi:hypothetical protein DSM110093_03769 (plasmid) [Sulfitobacter sp. DSM 110093]|nr:hypothetical protein DSM110093_03508 [Sulfitobacter sp. DSM 110093]UOA33934.1 hypothetical protein DSM110093_03769 [Sulfitobacter sp. DSM 110093]
MQDIGADQGRNLPRAAPSDQKRQQYGPAASSQQIHDGRGNDRIKQTNERDVPRDLKETRADGG